METQRVLDRTLNPLLVNLLGAVLTLLILFGVGALYFILWDELYMGFDTPTTILWLLVFGLSIVIHEGLHAVGYRLGGGRWRDIEFGVLWKYLTPYAHCKVPLPAGRYRLAVALPGLVLGLLPALVGLLIGSAALTFYGALMLCAATGDMLILALMLRVSSQARVQDHPTRPGFQILV